MGFVENAIFNLTKNMQTNLEGYGILRVMPYSLGQLDVSK
jgi:hypothetical protein